MNRASLLNSTIGEYRLVDFIGAGGMGEVFRGIHSKIGRVAAIKILTETAHGREFVERFFNEARIQASLQHPNIATLYDFLEFQGNPCIIMEYIDGVSLSDHIKAAGALPPSEALRVFRAVVEAIDYIHRNNIIHRDIKSNNIKISSTGQVKLLDFGIAKGQASMHLTVTGGVIGTPYYLSPEQLKGFGASTRTDIWALGVLLYEMVTGQLPFASATLGELCEKIGSVSYTPPTQLNPGIPREVAQIIERCLRKEPNERYQSTQDILRDINRADSPAPRTQPSAVNSQTNPARPGNEEAESASWLKGNWKLIAAGGAFASVIALFLIVGAVLWAMSGGTGQGADNRNTAPAAANVTPLAQGNKPTRTIQIDVDEGKADIYRDTQKIGTTPYSLDARVGERINLTLRRDGYQDRNISFEVMPGKPVYTYSMKK